MTNTTDTALLRFSRSAMATVFELVLPWGTPHASDSASEAFQLIDCLESQLTVYRDTSEVSRLNRIAHQTAVPVEQHLFKLLRQCETLSRQTHGAFDITSGPLTKAWGFFRRQGRVPSDAELAAAMSCVGMDKVVFDDARNTVRFTRPGAEINLGSIGKGYALDRVGALLRERFGITDALIHAGTSSVLAMGERQWQVGLTRAQESTRYGTVRLKNRAMATSGIAYQHLEHDNRKLGHLIDPRNGRPVEGVSLAAAFADSAAEADALATAFFVMGVESTDEYCQMQERIGAILVDERAGKPFDAIGNLCGWAPAEPSYSPPLKGGEPEQNQLRGNHPEASADAKCASTLAVASRQ